MKYVLTDNSRIDFIAHAPMHAFKGWAIDGLRAEAEIDVDQRVVHLLRAEVETRCFDTADHERTEAMRRHFSLPEHPRAVFAMSGCREFHPVDGNRWQTKLIGVLEFVDIRRQLPVNGLIRLDNGRLLLDLQCKWSFSAYGLKAPRLLFLAVRDIVDINAHLEFIPLETKEDIDAHP